MSSRTVWRNPKKPTCKPNFRPRPKQRRDGGFLLSQERPVPTEEEAVEMLLTMGGVAVSSAGAPAAAPPEARAIVRYCNRLPLAIGIAAQLVKELALDGGDWNGVLSIMREEFEQGGQAQSMEESVIATSLKAIRGSQVREHLSSICDAFPCRFAALFNA